MNKYNTEYYKRYRKLNVKKVFYIRVKSRAKYAGIDFDLSEEDIVIPEYCPILGIKINTETEIGGGAKDDRPSLDRINPNLGYIKGNVRVISQKANRLKQDLTIEITEKLLLYMRGQI